MSDISLHVILNVYLVAAWREDTTEDIMRTLFLAGKLAGERIKNSKTSQFTSRLTGDAVFGAIVVAPLTVAAWRGMLNLMAMNLRYFPYAQAYMLGICIHICFTLMR